MTNPLLLDCEHVLALCADEVANPHASAADRLAAGKDAIDAALAYHRDDRWWVRIVGAHVEIDGADESTEMYACRLSPERAVALAQELIDSDREDIGWRVEDARGVVQ